MLKEMHKPETSGWHYSILFNCFHRFLQSSNRRAWNVKRNMSTTVRWHYDILLWVLSPNRPVFQLWRRDRRPRKKWASHKHPDDVTASIQPIASTDTSLAYWFSPCRLRASWTGFAKAVNRIETWRKADSWHRPLQQSIFRVEARYRVTVFCHGGSELWPDYK